MVWIIVMLMCCLPTVENKKFKKTENGVCKNLEIIVGQHGKEVEFNFSLSSFIEELYQATSEFGGERINQSEIHIRVLQIDSIIRFKKQTDSTKEYIIYKNGKLVDMDNSRTSIVLTNDTLVMKITKLREEDAGIYWIDLYFICFGHKALIIAGKPTIKELLPPNPVLKPEDNYTSITQLECHSVSTSIGVYPLSMYTVWYKNGMRMTDLDPTLSQINVTVDHNGGHFTCLVTDYLPCYQRLQTTKHFNVLNIEECNNVFESKTFIVQPEYPTIDVTLEPGQRKITVNKNEDLKVRCSAKCHPECKITWEKEFQVLKSSGSVFITETEIGKELKIENISSSHEGFYFCLVKNNHREARKGFTLSVTETADKSVNSECYMKVVVAVVVAIVFVIVVLVIMYRKYRSNSTHRGCFDIIHIYQTVKDNAVI